MKSRLKSLVFLHVLLMFYSVATILSKFAAGVEPLSWQFILLYVGIIAILGIYAIGWQQVLKRMPLTFAFSNKAITVVWGIAWGALLFSEPITATEVVGAALIIAGIVLFAHADGQNAQSVVESEDGLLGEDEAPS